MRGVASGDNGNHSGPLPSVGMYLDEQPITTIQGALDVHIYDIARVEVLAGPQGTLYGAARRPARSASSPTSPIRAVRRRLRPRGQAIARRRPRATSREGFVNVPLGDKCGDPPRRLVRARAVATSTMSRPTPRVPDLRHRDRQLRARRRQLQRLAIPTARARRSRSISTTTGPSRRRVMAQKTEGATAFRLRPARSAISRSRTGCRKIRTTSGCRPRSPSQGKISNCDITYAGAHLERDVDYAFRLFRLRVLLRHLLRLRRVLVRQRRRSHQSVAVHPWQRQVQQEQQRAALHLARRKPLAL